jgi:diguanylate cyclase (GGDEF)-like protein
LAFGLVFLSEPGQFLVFSDTNLIRLIVFAVVGPAIAVTVGLLHVREKRALKTERIARGEAEDTNRELLTLRAALQKVDYGVVLLDHELRAIFINEAFRKIWNLPDEKADSRPAFIALLYHGRDIGAYAVQPDDLNEYVAQRAASVRQGDEQPIDLRLANGDVLRFRCKTLPGGGRMLTYANVTDAVHRAEELQTLATTDPLTGIYNRRHLFALAEAEWTRFERHKRPLSILMMDIDHFKSINDRFGHDTGDKAIARLAEICRAAKRREDVLARIGGEEFAILMPETDARGAADFAERLRALVAKGHEDGADVAPRFTISIGAAQARVGADTFGKLMKRADAALYEAKRRGRNCVAVDAPDEGRQVA